MGRLEEGIEDFFTQVAWRYLGSVCLFDSRDTLLVIKACE